MPKNFWMIVTSPDVLARTLAEGCTVKRVSAQQRRKLERMEPGDRVIYYLSPARRFAAIATVLSRTLDAAPPGDGQDAGILTFKVNVRPDLVLRAEDYLDALQIGPRLEYVRKWIPEKWYLAFQGFLHLIPKSDFLLLEGEMHKVLALRRASAHPR